MPKESINDQLRDLKKDPDALDQSIGLNRILLTLIDSQKKVQKWLCILLVLSILCNVAICVIFVAYESQFVTTTETVTTITQDTGEGEGNNVYQSGENAQYIQGNSEEVTADGETDNHYPNDNDQIPE